MAQMVRTMNVGGHNYDYFSDGTVLVDGKPPAGGNAPQSTQTPTTPPQQPQAQPSAAESDSAQFGYPTMADGLGPSDDQQDGANTGMPAYSAGISPGESDSAQFGMSDMAYGGPSGAESDSAQFGMGGVDTGMGGYDPQFQYSLPGGYPTMASSSVSGPGITGWQSSTPFQDSRWNAPMPTPGSGSGNSMQSSQSRTSTPLDKNAVNNAGQPYLGGPGASMMGAGWQARSAMPTTLMDQYKSFLTDPQGGLGSPVFQAILNQGVGSAQRSALARGGNGGGLVPAEMMQAGIAAAGNYLPAMANMYQGGANTEAQRYGTENAANVSAGTLGLNAWNSMAQDQLARASGNYGMQQTANAQNLAEQQLANQNQYLTMMMNQGY